MKNKKYFITGGGTGGHIYPAIAVADKLLEDETTEKLFYVGNPNNLEATIVKDKNYEFLPVISSGMPRKFSKAFFIWIWQMFFAFIKCLGYIRKYNPDAVFGTGGYVSAPVLLASVVMRKPFVMHDCDANPGLVTRLLSPFANSISIAFDIAKTKLHNKNCFVNGNPIRSEFKTVTKEQARMKLNLADKMTVCIMGGSQGAKSINNSAVQILEKLVKNFDIQIIFQTGKRNYDKVADDLKSFYPNYENDKNLVVKPYFDDMISVLKASDIVVSRAGSLSISEVCASSLGAIFIPYPYAASDHQRKNAKFMEENMAGIYMEDAQVTPETLFEKIKQMIENHELLANLRNNAEKLAKYDGVDKIVNQIKISIGEDK